MTDIKELKEEVLEKVTVGVTTNADGTYSFYAGEIFTHPLTEEQMSLYEVCDNYLNVSLNSHIWCFNYLVASNGNLMS